MATTTESVKTRAEAEPIYPNKKMKPDLDKGESHCETVVATAFNNQPGVLGAVIAPERDSVAIDYDPAQLNDAEAGNLVATVALVLRQNYAKCTLRLAGRACESCALHLERKAEKLTGMRRATASFVGGLMSVSCDKSVLTADTVTAELKALGAPVQPLAEAEQAEAADDAATGWSRWFRGERLEITCTVATQVFMLAGWFAGRALPEASWLRWSLYALAYGTGGFFGVQAGWQSLRKKTSMWIC